MGSVKVSIIIPAYNVEDYIEQCIKSVIQQSYSNIEIIVINDGSTDGTRKIIEKYIENNENLVLKNQDNQGQSAARNKGIELSKGEYIMFLDSDDYLSTNTVKNLVSNIEKYEPDLIRFS